jgi:hypothetical protein
MSGSQQIDAKKSQFTEWSPRRDGIALLSGLGCGMALAKYSGAVQFQRIGAEKGDSGWNI